MFTWPAAVGVLGQGNGPERLAADKPNIGIIIQASGPSTSISPDQALYAGLKPARVHLITDLFRHDVITRGYFDRMYQDEKELTRTATTVGRGFCPRKKGLHPDGRVPAEPIQALVASDESIRSVARL